MRGSILRLIPLCVVAACVSAPPSAGERSPGADPAAEGGAAPAEPALACVEAAPAGSPADRLSWMLGTWISEEDGVPTTERWCIGQGGVLIGDNVTRAPGGVRSELLRIEGRGDRLVYIASPDGQATTEFAGDLRCGSDRGNCARSCEAVFANPEHDFPQEITYGRCLQNEFLVATIRGGDRRASWTFRRAGASTGAGSRQGAME